MEREKIMAQLKRGCSPSPDFQTEDEEEDRRNNVTNTVRLIHIKGGRLGTFLPDFSIRPVTKQFDPGAAIVNFVMKPVKYTDYV